MGSTEAELPHAADVAGAVVDRAALERAFDRLPIDERTILVLHHLDGRSLASIAVVLQDPRGDREVAPVQGATSLERALERESER